MDELTPTAEQQRALDLFATGDPLVIEAGAGTGKTSTLELLARSTPRAGCYVAFNKAIAVEAGRRFPMTVSARTMHSLAFAATARQLNVAERLTAPRMPSWKVAVELGVRGIPVKVVEPEPRIKMLQPSLLGSHIMRGLRRFCESGDREPAVGHFPYLHGIDRHLGPPANNDAVNRRLLPALQEAWADVSSRDGRLRFTHEHYLKVWQLGHPELPGEFVLFDEAQDANGVMHAVLAAQAGKQMVYVGDSQQQIYEWRGAINALDLLVGTRTYLSQSFRFGPAIAEVANLILEMLDSPLRLVGTTIASTVGPVADPRAVLCRCNSTAVNVVLAEQARGRAVHLVGGGGEIVEFAHAAARLMAGEPAMHPELACFDTWREVVEYVKEDPDGSELRMLVKLVEDYGVQIILSALEGGVPEDQADVVVSTAHKAKGREWPTVRLASDFDPPPDVDVGAGEWRLLYVACTRARERLDVTGCPPVRDLLPAEGA